MEDNLLLRKEATRTTPFVLLDPDNSVLEISGRSSPDNSIAFYDPIMDALVAYVESKNEKLIVDFKLEYFNTSSTKSLFSLFAYLKSKEEQLKLTFNWFTEEDDLDLIETGEDFRDLLDLRHFNFVFIDEE